ncbi:tRNA (guanosine(46)-N7)-methyltransferase TrmB [Candidatus Providencia siddallii]|uniref:tRNA (guanine-N(7)-)-methyltransferase n=1 Tax=Candidatus Providencia siddallii TaxID=1715285 RepID=A0ABM9NNL7_9GAMM
MTNKINLLNYKKECITKNKIRSFINRKKKLTKNQIYILNNIWEEIEINFNKKQCDLSKIFNNFNEVIMEIGFGIGTSLIDMAIQNPKKNFLGIEVYKPGIATCLMLIKEKNIKNLKIIRYDAIDILDFMIPNNSLSIIQLFFPDPWHKTKHNKRRIVQISFIEKIYAKLINNGVFHMATDWEPYAKHVISIMKKVNYFINLSKSGNYVPRPKTRPKTKFEIKGEKLGHNIYDLMFKKIQ